MISEMLSGLVSLAFLLPTLAVGARRLHDIGRSGWWQLLFLTGIGLLVLIYWWVQPAGEGGSEYDAATARVSMYEKGPQCENIAALLRELNLVARMQELVKPRSAAAC